jgi:hypothetical protein
MDIIPISADDHIDMPWLPKDLWQKRVPPQWRERAPRVEDTADGPYWFCGADRWDPWGGRKGTANVTSGRRSALDRGGVLEPGVLRPTTTALRLADMDRDGVDATVMYGPIVPLLIKDQELRQVCYRAYNEWLAEFCAERGISHTVQPYMDFGGSWHPASAVSASGGACAARKNICVYPNGDVVKCFDHRRIPLAREPLGNIAEEDVIAILCKRRATEVSRLMKSCDLSCKQLSCNLPVVLG